MRGLAETFASAGFHVELPLLAGHGTSQEDLAAMRWRDWSSSVEAAYQRLTARVDSAIVVGLSMGGAMTVWAAAEHPELAGIACVNPLVHEPVGLVDTLREMQSAGEEFLPHRPNDIADPNATDVRYERTPVSSLISLFEEGVAPLAARHQSIQMPLLLMTSLEDHSVPATQSDLLATGYGGPVERVSLTRSFHIATLDYDKDVIESTALAFAQRVFSAG